MTMRRTEHPHFTRDQVVEHVRDAVAIAKECGLTDRQEAALLPTIVDKLASKQVVMEEIGLAPNMVVPRGMG